MAEQNNRGISMSARAEKRKIENPELVEAIKAMRENFTPETQNKVINLALRCTFLVPGIVEKNQELVADENNHVSFQDKQTAKFILINHKERGSFFPVFTDAEELKKLPSDQPYKPFAMKFSDIAGLTENTPQVNGFVLNPYSQNLPFSKEMLESIKQTLIKYRQQKAEAEKAAAENSSEEN